MPTLSRLKRASDFDVKDWIHETAGLSDYQKSKFDSESVRLSPFYFYEKREDEPVSPLWRITLLAFPFYWCFLLALLPFKFIITGKWGYGQKFLEAFHYKWLNKLKL